MVHVRLNQAEPNPNHHINFITALPTIPEQQEEARQLLRALAAQVRPVMKSHGFAVNSLEEYEYNQVFAGRNWNAGETIELVLRRPGGSFYPAYWLMSTLCHELAHIKHMNHGPAFQALWKRLRAQVRQLQDRGYYGDGYWSSGTRLSDSARITGDGIQEGDLPEYMCGGAQSRTRPTATRRRRTTQGKRRETVPSVHTGRQTAIKRKAGARVTSKYAFTGQGSMLDSGGDGKGFGKQAASKRAREERALATERRLRALQGAQEPVPSDSLISRLSEALTEDEESDLEFESVGETDAERREALLKSDKDADLSNKLGRSSSWKGLEQEFDFNNHDQATLSNVPIDDIIDISSDDDNNDHCNIGVASGSTFIHGHSNAAKGKGKSDPSDDIKESTSSKACHPKPNAFGAAIGLGRMVKAEIDLRKKESLGMAPVKGSGHTLGSRSTGMIRNVQSTPAKWDCLVCTLENQSGHLSCSACSTPRGDQTWSQKA